MLDPLLAAAAPPQHLPGVLHSLEPTLNRFGYLALGLIFLEDFGVPVPGETVLIIAAVYAGTGRFNVWLVGLIGFLAAILGDNVGFAIGHFGGRPLAERFGKYIFLTPERLDKTANFFDRHGGKVIVIARFVEGLRQANGIIAGITGMHWTKFVPFNALGAALWVAVWVSIGYFSGSNIDSIYATATRYEAVFGIVVGVLILALVARRVWKHQKGRAAKIAALSESAMSEPTESESTMWTESESTTSERAESESTMWTESESTTSERAEPDPPATESADSPEPTEPAAPEAAGPETTGPETTGPETTGPEATGPSDSPEPTDPEASATDRGPAQRDI
jgi:membrane protein DedA with SNARE-associated domain